MADNFSGSGLLEIEKEGGREGGRTKEGGREGGGIERWSTTDDVLSGYLGDVTMDLNDPRQRSHDLKINSNDLYIRVLYRPASTAQLGASQRETSHMT